MGTVELDSIIDRVPAKYSHELSGYLVGACVNFAKLCIDTNIDLYKKRGQYNRHEIIKQIAVGKMAEFAVWYIVLKMGIVCTAPDLQVYEHKLKSYEADLHGKGFDFHIKTQEHNKAINYGLSWLMQKNDPLVLNPNKKDIVCLTLIKNNIVYLLHRCRASELLPVYSEPKKEQLRKTKTAIYFKDLIK